jgi:formiminotetrahydrofolate cyclodeaminase
VPPATLANSSLGDVLDRLAARTPAPGGGSAAALACATAAALVEMAASFADGPPAVGSGAGSRTAGRTASRGGALRARALELADADQDSYAPVLDAVRLAADDPARPRALAAALSGAAEVPLQIARVGAEVAALAAALAADGSPHLTGDAVTAALLAEGACAAGAALVAINLSGAVDARPTEAAQLLAEATAARQQALAKVNES